MKKVKRVEVIEHEDILEGITCDRCESEVEDKSTYFGVTTGHNSWGGDSDDSIERNEYCSMKCTNKEMAEYFKRVGTCYGNPTSEYFNVTCRVLVKGTPDQQW